MSKINLLDSQIYNRIAAGEVVERPFSVVKELVENSIDAGADNIKIDIIDGGISSIEISDNGSGIEKSELVKALLPHATSKIACVEDLDNIMSLGFRGEALASIASVSKITIASKPKNQDFGASISSDGGINAQVIDSACADGTTISVKNLFFNTPVRAKFLHSVRSEENEISATIARFILCNPNISFKYTADGETIYQSFGDGLESAMVCIYGADIIKNCILIDTEKNGIKISGYLGNQHFSKGNRSYQTIFINGRYIVNQTVSAAISNAYAPYMMKRQYPFCVLNLSVPTEIVDVNVHPNKLDVRFANNQIVYGAVYSVISKMLDGSSEALNIAKQDSQNSQSITVNSQNDYTTHKSILSEVINYKKEIADSKNLLRVTFSDSKTPTLSEQANTEIKKEEVTDIFAENKAFLESLNRKNNQNTKQEEISVKKELQYAGQVLNTYLIFEDGSDIYFADQHAAHERILFDKLNHALENHQVISQPLLLPFILNVNSVEFNFIRNKLSILCDMGIDIEEFGKNSFKISAIPSFLTEMNIQAFFDDILGEIDNFKTLTITSVLTEKIAQKACKSAIKAGDRLSDLEIKTLTQKLNENLGLKCPHGRPVVVKITRMEIDKWFKRIV